MTNSDVMTEITKEIISMNDPFKVKVNGVCVNMFYYYFLVSKFSARLKNDR